MYYVYILRCKDKTLYTGITTDVERRFREHKTQSPRGARYTRAHHPDKIVHTESFTTRSDALKREAEIKKWTRAKKMALINAK